MVSFDEYNRQTEELIAFMLARLAEDDVLAGATPGPRLARTLVRMAQHDITYYRAAVRDYYGSTGIERRYNESLARLHAFSLRFTAWQDYRRHGDYDPHWSRAPRAVDGG